MRILLTVLLFANLPLLAQSNPRTEAGAVTPTVKDYPRHVAFLARIKQGEIGLLFLGDSITDFWPGRGADSWAKFAPYNPADFGIAGDRTEHVLWRITHGELDGIHPKVVVLLIGINNLAQLGTAEKPEWAAAGVKKILDTVREKLPDSKILLLGVFPIRHKDDVQRPRVVQLNSLIQGFADGVHIQYLYFGDKFLDPTGEIPADVMPDGVHPSAKGYAIWYAAMSPTLDEMMK